MGNGKISNKTRNDLTYALEKELDTRDKRYMFLRLEFKDFLYNLNIEGSPRDIAWDIYRYFEKQCMIGELIETMNVKFDYNIKLELENE